MDEHSSHFFLNMNQLHQTVSCLSVLFQEPAVSHNSKELVLAKMAHDIKRDVKSRGRNFLGRIKINSGCRWR